MNASFRYEGFEESDVLEIYAVQKLKNDLLSQHLIDANIEISIIVAHLGELEVSLSYESLSDSKFVCVKGRYVFDCIDRLVANLHHNLAEPAPVWDLKLKTSAK